MAPPGGDAEPGRVVVDADGEPHVVNYRDDLIAGQPSYHDALTDQLSARGLSEADFTDLVQKPLADLSRDEVITLIEIRDSLPPVGPDDVLQKLSPPGHGAPHPGRRHGAVHRAWPAEPH